jgi:UDP-N-acetylglucosamine 1-carboxyvinyltransferase
MGVNVEEGEDSITVSSDGQLKGAQITTAPYPGFPTDMQPQFGVLLAVANGPGIIYEKVWENRFAYLDELMRMGASVPCNNFTAWFPGNQKLHASSVTATDLRGGAAMVIAALMAEGTTEIKNIHYIDRGYDDLIGKLREVGACIVREEVTLEGAPLSAGSSS